MTSPATATAVAADTGGAITAPRSTSGSRRVAQARRLGPVVTITSTRLAPSTSTDGSVELDARTTPDDARPRVLLVDDHDLFRTGLRTLLEEQGVDVVGEADTGTEALQQIREVAPDVVVMDLNMPGISGVEATRQIAMIAPLTRVLVLTISDQDADVMDAILAGACGYLLKDASIDELMAGIARPPRGESLVSPAIASKVLQRLRATSSVAARRRDDPLRALRPRDPGAEADRERQGQRA